MTRRITQSLLQRISKFWEYLEWRYNKNSYDSIYFYTFHKCASSLFADYVLKNIVGLRNVDYMSLIWSGEKFDALDFEKKGFIYGPIRLSTRPTSPMYKLLIEPASDSDFIQSKTAIFLVRDPRDILVSSYYSSGYTHALSPVKEIREVQEKIREKIQSQDIDQYVMENAQRLTGYFDNLDRLSKACSHGIILKYEDMIFNWEMFVKDLTKYIDIKQDVLLKIHETTRPRTQEDRTSHKRSGKPGGFHDKLKYETVMSLNTTFEDILNRYGYNE